jgi:hypothetical protein
LIFSFLSDASERHKQEKHKKSNEPYELFGYTIYNGIPDELIPKSETKDSEFTMDMFEKTKSPKEAAEKWKDDDFTMEDFK